MMDMEFGKCVVNLVTSGQLHIWDGKYGNSEVFTASSS
jgi:hypothetical protein